MIIWEYRHDNNNTNKIKQLNVNWLLLSIFALSYETNELT